ncbi:MAG: NADH-quinone oxidoreductase subunit NuoK [Candidatus Omnitrophota bacterium]
MIPIPHLMLLSAALFALGVAGLIMRRNIILILLSVELMLNAANLNFISASVVQGNLHGQITAFFVMVVAAAEVTIGLAVAVLLFRRTDSVDTSAIETLRD